MGPFLPSRHSTGYACHLACPGKTEICFPGGEHRVHLGCRRGYLETFVRDGVYHHGTLLFHRTVDREVVEAFGQVSKNTVYINKVWLGSSFFCFFFFSFFGETEGICASLGSSRLRCYYMSPPVMDDGCQDLYVVYE